MNLKSRVNKLYQCAAGLTDPHRCDVCGYPEKAKDLILMDRRGPDLEYLARCISCRRHVDLFGHPLSNGPIKFIILSRPRDARPPNFSVAD